MSGDSKSQADFETIRRTLDILVPPGAVAELRVPNTPGRGTVSGYFNDLRQMAESGAALSGKVEGVYVTLNPVSSDLLARAQNRTRDFAKHTTADGDVVRRLRLLVDFDPLRPAGISANDTEHQAALERARQCCAWLSAEGWPHPLVGDWGTAGTWYMRWTCPTMSGVRS